MMMQKLPFGQLGWQHSLAPWCVLLLGSVMLSVNCAWWTNMRNWYHASRLSVYLWHLLTQYHLLPVIDTDYSVSCLQPPSPLYETQTTEMYHSHPSDGTRVRCHLFPLWFANDSTVCIVDYLFIFMDIILHYKENFYNVFNLCVPFWEEGSFLAIHFTSFMRQQLFIWPVLVMMCSSFLCWCSTLVGKMPWRSCTSSLFSLHNQRHPAFYLLSKLLLITLGEYDCRVKRLRVRC